jgi:predicted glutamine amidotransferase
MSAGAQRAQATFWLLDAPDSLSKQSHREPDGTGLGWFDAQRRPHVSKQPVAAFADSDFSHEAHELCSTTFIAHIRFASTGALELKNTHPFEQQGRLFAHNGVIEDLQALDAHLGAALSLVQGDTDSERFFALITHEIATHGGDLDAGIACACRWIASNLPLYAINFVLATADGLWAFRYPETHPLYVLDRSPGKRLEHSSSHGTRVRSEDGRKQPLVVIASERMDADPGWRLLDSGELLKVSATLELSSSVLLDGPPAKPLTLDDLGARAKASQATSPAEGG